MFRILGEHGPAALNLINFGGLFQFSFCQKAICVNYKFEAKDVTAGHPPESVGPENHALYSKGHVQNVRRGGDFTIADVVIKDIFYGSRRIGTAIYATGGSIAVTIDMDLSTGILKFDSQSITMASGGLTALMATNMPYLIYATKYAATKWYSVEIYKNKALTRQMIPCKNPSGAAGFYDLVNGYFYALTGTSGAIAAGPAV